MENTQQNQEYIYEAPTFLSLETKAINELNNATNGLTTVELASLLHITERAVRICISKIETGEFWINRTQVTVGSRTLTKYFPPTKSPPIPPPKDERNLRDELIYKLICDSGPRGVTARDISRETRTLSVTSAIHKMRCLGYPIKRGAKGKYYAYAVEQPPITSETKQKSATTDGKMYSTAKAEMLLTAQDVNLLFETRVMVRKVDELLDQMITKIHGAIIDD